MLAACIYVHNLCKIFLTSFVNNLKVWSRPGFKITIFKLVQLVNLSSQEYLPLSGANLNRFAVNPGESQPLTLVNPI